MNDIYMAITKVSLYNYADDNTLSAVGSSKQEVVDCISQESLVAVQLFKDNMMETNSMKFQAMLPHDTNDSTSIPMVMVL